MARRLSLTEKAKRRRVQDLRNGLRPDTTPPPKRQPFGVSSSGIPYKIDSNGIPMPYVRGFSDGPDV